ncbi:hypothetical protein KNU39_gp55 [Gordonia phage Mutzi]|uniref:Uncharacterized protein n=3 Tax=Wizardvirus TaxID=2169658 RepID=A0A7D5FL26_9CAUD|nr:hypothetical protein KNU39_gp55 [Gordonia phage Mutzi]YP_010104272.1 hypothetical protein KNU74_gp58 [Gordonia phage Fireball]YP_010109317.1 hypothetical protein KNV15_gp55 [Gordonia phage Jambalaya]QWY84744.1 hypothetical protein SEA_YUNGMONEY_58 [Gordonia phage YungMoney]WKW87182.1 hypothetical protein SAVBUCKETDAWG_55 [Gordonia phage Savbucketdawg]QAX92866.1 hypothetical protein SEA_MUTZI_55 [Gordonia phage Mutzi]QFP95883.1 hypothetical protein SEA_FIREBALL_58 [Gordonia phage Fireball]
MTKVTNMNGDGGSPAGMFFHRFSGGGPDQFEFPGNDPRAYLGDTFSMTVRAELVKVITDEIADGQRQILAFRVVDSAPVKLVARADGHDPAQTSIDDIDDAPPPDDNLDSDLTEPAEKPDDNPAEIFSDKKS